MHRLHDGGGVNQRRGHDGRRRHGVGHGLHGRLRHLALHGDQDRLVAEKGACWGGRGRGGSLHNNEYCFQPLGGFKRRPFYFREREKDALPVELCAKRASWMTAGLGWTVAVWVGAGGGVGSDSMGTGDPSRDRLSGVWTPLEVADRPPGVWLGETGALLGRRKKEGR